MKHYVRYFFSIFLLCMPGMTGDVQEVVPDAPADAVVPSAYDVNALFEAIKEDALRYMKGTIGSYVGCGTCQGWQNFRAHIPFVGPSEKKKYADLRSTQYEEFIRIIENKDLDCIEKARALWKLLNEMRPIAGFTEDTFFNGFRKQTRKNLNKCRKKMEPEIDTCIVCLENKPEILFRACGHYVCCRSCVAQIESGACPQCRARISERDKTEILLRPLCITCKKKKARSYCPKKFHMAWCEDCFKENASCPAADCQEINNNVRKIFFPEAE